MPQLDAWFETGAAGIAHSAVTAHGAVQKKDELADFWRLLLSRRPRSVCEIGSYAGGTLWAWQQLPGPPLVVGIDLAAGSTFAATGAPRQGHGAVMIDADSHDPATPGRLLDVLGGTPLDVLFIDGDHSYRGVKADWEMYGPLVAPGGIVAFHDITPHPDQPGIEVSKLWAEICEGPSEVSEIVSGEPWGGIGVVHRVSLP